MKIEELMVAEAISEENPQGRTLLQVGPKDGSVLASIVPEFAQGDMPGRLFIYYYDSETSKYLLDIYSLPFGESGQGGIGAVTGAQPGFTADGTAVAADGEIKVFTADGMLVASGTGSVEFASLEPGIYIINAGGKSYKIMK
ncbi:MAG: hypothetical protein K2K81_08485 [Muribaculaceae bacterium]|nr:hypothetical protein [Muribaculaceae bacterium]